MSSGSPLGWLALSTDHCGSSPEARSSSQWRAPTLDSCTQSEPDKLPVQYWKSGFCSHFTPVRVILSENSLVLQGKLYFTASVSTGVAPQQASTSSGKKRVSQLVRLQVALQITNRKAPAIWRFRCCNISHLSIYLSIYIIAVELLSGPSLALLEVIIWSKFVFF